MQKSSIREPLAVPCREAAAAPLLPFIYVAWADGALTRDEIDGLRKSIRAAGVLAEPACTEVERWLDPDQPPSAEKLNALRGQIRDLAAGTESAPPESLTALGVRLAHAAGAGPAWTDGEGPEALREFEDQLGVHGGAAARGLLAPDRRPVGSDQRDDAAFDTAAMARHLNRNYLELRADLFALLQTPEMASARHLDTSDYRERTLEQVRLLADRGYGSMSFPKSVGGQSDVGGSIAVFETLAYGDLSVVVKYGVQFGLFGGSILNLGGPEQHERFLAQVGTLELPGCFAMSETLHGSNVRDLETTAVYLPETAEFEVSTPHALARKDWIGNAALHGRMATVFAQLEVAGQRHGVHALLVPIRDQTGAVLPGVSIGDCGAKVGLNGVDNGWIAFDTVRVPRANLLSRFAQVTPDGSYASDIQSPGRRFFTMIGTLVAGRVSIAAASLSATKTALAIAVRYSDRRRQFGPPEAPEVPILNYTTQQRLLLQPLATTYALNFAIRDLAETYAAHPNEPDREVEVLAAGLKAFASWHNLATIQACREACGGKGYLSENRFGALRDDTDVFTTFEGANVVLLQLVAKGLLTRFRESLGDLNVWGMVRYLTDQAGTRIAALNPVLGRRTDADHLTDPDFHLGAFRYREERLLTSAASRLKGRLDDGMDSFDAMNAVQDHLVTLALAHVDRVLLEALLRGVARAPSPELSDVLQDVESLYALSTLERHAAWYLESGYIEPSKAKAIRTEVNQTLARIRPQAVHLVDGFGIPDAVLSAPAAFVQEIG